MDVDEELDGTAAPFGRRADAVAVLLTTPASTSACVTTWALALHVVEAPGARVETGQETAPALGSGTTGAW